MTDANLLFGSKSLTREEEQLRAELEEWCKAKLRKGHNPIPLQCCLTILADRMRELEKWPSLDVRQPWNRKPTNEKPL